VGSVNETYAGREPDRTEAGQTVPLTADQVTACFRTVMDLLMAQQVASLSIHELADGLPQNLLPENRCTIEFLASAIDKVDGVLAGVVEELEILRASVVGIGSADSTTAAATGNE
jgi:hypothetical protein